MKSACIITFVLLGPGSSAMWAQSPAPLPASGVKIDYDQHVKPILAGSASVVMAPGNSSRGCASTAVRRRCEAVITVL